MQELPGLSPAYPSKWSSALGVCDAAGAIIDNSSFIPSLGRAKRWNACSGLASQIPFNEQRVQVFTYK